MLRQSPRIDSPVKGSSKTDFTDEFRNQGWNERNPMGHKFFPASCLLIILSLGTCAPSKSSFFGELEWEAMSLDGNRLSLTEIDKELIALNVYSPDCVPCWKELPTLHFLHSEISEKYPNLALYLVVDPYQIVPDLPRTVSFGEAFGKAKERMQKEIQLRNITIPVLFMKPPFEVKDGGLVTGTPETLLFETKPLRLYYNFIGSISEETKLEDIKKNTKVNFFRHQFGMISP
jgi:hypothetical protein